MADFLEASGGCCLLEEPGALLPQPLQSGWPSEDPNPRRSPSLVACFAGVIQLCSLPTGHNILDALCQHCLCHLLRRRTRPWAQYVPQSRLYAFCISSPAPSALQTSVTWKRLLGDRIQPPKGFSPCLLIAKGFGQSIIRVKVVKQPGLCVLKCTI